MRLAWTGYRSAFWRRPARPVGRLIALGALAWIAAKDCPDFWPQRMSFSWVRLLAMLLLLCRRLVVGFGCQLVVSLWRFRPGTIRGELCG